MYYIYIYINIHMYVNVKEWCGRSRIEWVVPLHSWICVGPLWLTFFHTRVIWLIRFHIGLIHMWHDAFIYDSFTCDTIFNIHDSSQEIQDPSIESRYTSSQSRMRRGKLESRMRRGVRPYMVSHLYTVSHLYMVSHLLHRRDVSTWNMLHHINESWLIDES